MKVIFSLSTVRWTYKIQVEITRELIFIIISRMPRNIVKTVETGNVNLTRKLGPSRGSGATRKLELELHEWANFRRSENVEALKLEWSRVRNVKKRRIRQVPNIRRTNVIINSKQPRNTSALSARSPAHKGFRKFRRGRSYLEPPKFRGPRTSETPRKFRDCIIPK